MWLGYDILSKTRNCQYAAFGGDAVTKSKSAQKCVRMHCSLQFCSLLPFEFKNTSCGFQALRKPGLNRAGGSCLSSRSCLLHQQLRSPMQSTAMTTITVHQSLDAIDERTCSSCNLLILKHAWRADSFALASPRAPAWQDTFAMIRGPAAVCCISLVGTQLPWMKTVFIHGYLDPWHVYFLVVLYCPSHTQMPIDSMYRLMDNTFSRG